MSHLFNVSIASSQSEFQLIPLPNSPASVKFLEFGLFVPNNASVELNGCVGLQAISGNPVVFFKVFRNDLLIFSCKQMISYPTAALHTANLHFVDRNVPAGYYGYSITAEVDTSNINFAGTGQIIGPSVLSGTIYLD